MWVWIPSGRSKHFVDISNFDRWELYLRAIMLEMLLLTMLLLTMLSIQRILLKAHMLKMLSELPELSQMNELLSEKVSKVMTWCN